MDCKLIDKLIQILFSQSEEVVKEGLWTLSNLMANGNEQTSAFVNSSTANRVITLSTNMDVNLRNEAQWVLTNVITCGSDQDIRVLM